MKEYIERDWLVKEAEAVLVFRERHYTDKNRIADAASTVEWLKYYAPAADVAEVRHAKWTTRRTEMHDGEWYCTGCDYEPQVFENSKYCPNCGALMNKEDA